MPEKEGENSPHAEGWTQNLPSQGPWDAVVQNRKTTIEQIQIQLHNVLQIQTNEYMFQ
jgi:hypothetical protein